jgi:hypothetical protein
MDKCPKCGEMILWAKLKKQKVPVNYDPNLTYLFGQGLVEFEKSLKMKIHKCKNTGRKA